jgi:hypothetical protein
MSTNNNNLKSSGNLISLTAKHPQSLNQQQQQQSQVQQQKQQQQKQQNQIKQDTQKLIQNSKLVGHQTQTQQHQNQQLQHPLPPRYQPPPQPPGGILKHIQQPSTNGSKPIPTLIYPSEVNGTHLNIKYPPEVPKLTSVYLSENFRTSRIVPPRTNLRLSNGIPISTQHTNQSVPQQQQHQPLPTLHRLPSEEEQHTNRLLQTQQQSQQQQQQQHQQQLHQQQEMLKFVRKPESDPSSTPNSSTSGRITADQQNRHFQVREI